MTIKRSTFSGWQLSGEEADAFIEKVSNPIHNQFAQATVERGSHLALQYATKGYVILNSGAKDLRIVDITEVSPDMDDLTAHIPNQTPLVVSPTQNTLVICGCLVGASLIVFGSILTYLITHVW